MESQGVIYRIRKQVFSKIGVVINNCYDQQSTQNNSRSRVIVTRKRCDSKYGKGYGEQKNILSQTGDFQEK